MKKNNQTRAEIVFDEINEVENMLSEQPKESTHITWWKGLNEEEQTKLCQKHFQGIPVESLMERSIKVMYHYENPETTTNTVTGEGFTKGNWAVRDYEVIGPYGSHKTICEMTGNLPKEEKKANAKRIVNCVNGWDKLQAENQSLQAQLNSAADLEGLRMQENEALKADNERLREALKVAMASLGTYGRHPLIEQQANKALQNK